MVWKRVVSAIVFGVIVLGALIWDELAFTFAIALAAVIGSVELFNLFEKRGEEAVPTAAAVGILGALAYVFVAHFKGFASYGYVTIGIIFVCFLWYMLVLKHVKPTRAIAMTVFASLLSGLCLSHLVLLRDLKLPGGWEWLIVIYLLVLIWVYDIFAWAIGRKLGRRKIAPAISPNKSVEGAIAGTASVFIAAVLFRLIVQAIHEFHWFSIGVAMIIAAMVCVLGPLGDLAESMVKRDFGVKDMGGIIPEHGGIMDRFDSTLFTAPAVFYYLFYFALKFK